MSADEGEVEPPTTERRRSIFHLKNIHFKNEIKDHSKTTQEKQQISRALQSNEFLKNLLTDTIRNLIVDFMTPQLVKKHEVIINQDEVGEFMYVSQTGVYQVLKNNVEVHQFGENIVFGEVAIIYNHTRHATVKALADGKLWALHKDDYSRIMISNAMAQETELLEFLKKVPVLCEAPDSKLQQATGLFTKVTYSAGTKIVREGHEGKDFFIIKAGTAKVYKKSAEGSVAQLGRGQYFGEQALLTDHGVRQATVIAESAVVECLVLHFTYFINLFGGMKQFLQGPTEDATETDSTIVIDPEYQAIKLHDLKLKTTIGIGGYGRVELSYLKTNEKQLFALKYMSRERMVRYDLVKNIQREKDIQIRCNHPFIVKLHKTYNDRRYLYLLQEYCPGGDLLNVLQRSRAHYCKENDAKFLMACVFDAIGYLHERNVIYRDIKPENLVLDGKGYVKLTDFGCARKLLPGARTFSMHGAPEYIPPEVIYQRGCDRAVDYWACGELTFELLVGKTPFKTNDASYMQTYNLIVKGIEHVKFPSRVSKNATDLIMRLCNATPSQRLGYCSGVQEIRDHKWFQGFDWVKLRNYQITSPIGIKLASAMDTKYFDKFKPDRDLPPMDDSTVLNDF